MSNLNFSDIIEALLFASEKPVPFKKLAQILELAPDALQTELEELREEKARIGSLQLAEVAGGWQLLTKPEYSDVIRRLRDVPRQKLSRAAFEVLAIVAYRQPATRADVEGLRGVDCSAPLQFLLEKKLIGFAGRKETPGKPFLFATTPQFLEHFGLRDIGDLPSLAELTELNEVSGIHDGDNLFNRGAMRSPEEQAAETAAAAEAVRANDAANAELAEASTQAQAAGAEDEAELDDDTLEAKLAEAAIASVRTLPPPEPEPNIENGEAEPPPEADEKTEPAPASQDERVVVEAVA